MKYENKLNEYPIFSNLIDIEIKKFKEKIELINFKSDDLIIKEGEEGKSILFLFEGDINISQALTLITNKSDSEDNREKELIRLSSMNQHISLGEISLFNIDKKRSATVKAISNCEVGRLTFDDLFLSKPHNKLLKIPIEEFSIAITISDNLIFFCFNEFSS